ncbi:hypothetical protein [Streptomyces sp. NPDC090025]|uniref:DUF6197 family protein n=1 Tax=Streptomyces sp. NPDC090025 TaxID=3365922 RepID=UPI0038333041
MPTTARHAATAEPAAPDTPEAIDSPDALDLAAARLLDTAAWQEIVGRWTESAPGPAGPGAPGGAGGADDWRRLLSVPVEQLVADALDAVERARRREAAGPAPYPGAAPLPGWIGAILPDRLHTWRRIGRADVLPSAHLAHARRVLTEWGWQNTPYRLRDRRGARCVCGAMLAAHRLGHGSAATMNEAGAWMLEELRSRGWHQLIGPWNRAPGRTATDALALVDATIARATRAGR